MIAYYVYDEKKDKDIILVPDMGCAASVDRAMMEAFISPSPVFAEWSGDTCADVRPEDFGTVVASRQEGGDVCIFEDGLWQTRMAHYLSKDD